MSFKFLPVLFLMGFLLGILPACSTQTKPTVNKEKSPYSTGPASRDGIGKFYFGREIAHVMGHLGARWLERVERNDEENTDQVIENMELKPDDWVADMGAGSGYYAFRVAEKVPDGKVFAVDIQEEMIAIMKDKQKNHPTTNIEFVLNQPKKTKLPEGQLDKVFMVDVYHELDYPQEIMQDIYRSLKPNGQFILLEYRMEDPKVPIKLLHKMTEKQAVKELAAVGFKLKENKANLPWQHFMVFVKKEILN